MSIWPFIKRTVAGNMAVNYLVCRDASGKFAIKRPSDGKFYNPKAGYPGQNWVSTDSILFQYCWMSEADCDIWFSRLVS